MKANRNSFLKLIYAKKLISLHGAAKDFCDKYRADALLRTATPKGKVFLPITFLLSDLMAESKAKNVREMKLFFQKKFPQGYIIKPRQGLDSDGEGFYFSLAQFLKNKKNPQEFIIQENLFSSNRGIKKTKLELRLHTFENQVIPEATFSRWNLFYDPKSFRKVEKKVEKFLKLLPKKLIKKQAWSLDVLMIGNQPKIIDINTNRGSKIHWSGDLSNPDVLGAYVRFFEKNRKIFFPGEAGQLLRNNQADRKKWIKKEGLRAVLAHERLMKKHQQSSIKTKTQEHMTR